jgi:hypothetical protein
MTYYKLLFLFQKNAPYVNVFTYDSRILYFWCSFCNVHFCIYRRCLHIQIRHFSILLMHITIYLNEYQVTNWYIFISFFWENAKLVYFKSNHWGLALGYIFNRVNWIDANAIFTYLRNATTTFNFRKMPLEIYIPLIDAITSN